MKTTRQLLPQFLNRLFTKQAGESSRSFDAAGGGRRWDKAATVGNLNSAILAASTVTARRAAYYVRNNAWVDSAVSSLVGNAVGAGIKPRSQHPDPAVRDALHTLWDAWVDVADAGGLGDFYGLQALAVRAMIEGGEAFARLRTRFPSDGLPVPFQVELIDREQVPLDRFGDFGSARIRAGIEFDTIGRRVAYHVLPARLDDPFAPLTGNPFNPTRVPAEDMVHLFRPIAAGQLRGITWLAPVLLRLHELDQFEDAALVRAKVNALFCGFVRDPDGTVAGQNDGSAVNGILDMGMEPGTLLPLPPGADIAFSDPKGDTSYDPFVKNHLRAIAAGLGLPYEAMTGDLSGVNYSSIRAGMVEFRRRLEQLQHLTIIHQLCRPVWERFVRLAVLSGALPVSDFSQNPAPYLAVKWLPPAFEWVDPVKDVRAEIEAINAGLKSRSQAIAERGYDAEQLDAEIAADREREQSLGLAFTDPPAAEPSQAPENPQ